MSAAQPQPVPGVPTCGGGDPATRPISPPELPIRTAGLEIQPVQSCASLPNRHAHGSTPPRNHDVRASPRHTGPHTGWYVGRVIEPLCHFRRRAATVSPRLPYRLPHRRGLLQRRPRQGRAPFPQPPRCQPKPRAWCDDGRRTGTLKAAPADRRTVRRGRVRWQA
jgi:hypothetical protein